MSECYEIEITAPVISKKNAYSQTRSGRRFKPQSVRDTELLALSQIPAEMVDLKLLHPAVEFQAYVPKKNWALDVDGLFTTCLDYLTKSGVIVDDCIRKFNGPKLIHPVIESDHKRFIIRLYPDGKLPQCNN